MCTMATRIRDFTWINPPEFHRSKVVEDLQEFIIEVKVLPMLRLSKNKLSNPKPQGSGGNGSSTRTYQRCGRNYLGICFSGMNDCFNCGKSGHKMRDFPMLATKGIKGWIVKLYVKISKCEFWLRFVGFLDHIVSGEGIQIDTKKTEAVKNCPRPLFASDIQSFLELVDYYRKFVEGFSFIALTLTTLTQKGSDDFVVYCDISRIDLGCVLMQHVKVITYASRQLKDLVRDVHILARLGVPLVDSNEGGVIVQNGSESFLISYVKAKKDFNPIMVDLKKPVYEKSH
ncbi:hypothetical protein MTR67_035690 [Solanum verrucosum]|uniref:CCHC-type domain-containing protein n=1 Tax=Solanum verrucosum TaxID=315347 RepID=A0AAF0ZLT7_SOLVR|nr:hypothetical protein MTR67_035690 [Solanum verrucosum]